MKNKLALDEIQGLLVSGYGKQEVSSFILLQISDKEKAKTWIKGIAPLITYSRNKESKSKLNIAFTYSAMQSFECPESELNEFSREFREGMVTPHRQRILGDQTGGAGDPVNWTWGGPENDKVDILLMVYELDSQILNKKLTDLRKQFTGVNIIKELFSTPLLDGKEHFGFRDGIAQPIIKENGKPGHDRDKVAAGEIILGYNDESGAMEPAPLVAVNGTYLVFRQINQDVKGFWSFFKQYSTDSNNHIHAASKMVGRWPDGTPLTMSPQPPTEAMPVNDFGFSDNDVDGSRCPLGSHIRRSNPRDALIADEDKSLAIVKRHRILRRGRSYGIPVDPSVYPGDLSVKARKNTGEIDGQRGLFFICLNASISRQFEFIQQTWLNNPKFLGVSAETDPIASPVEWSGEGPKGVFTMQSSLLRRRITGLQKYVQTVGGSYFFLPGRQMILHITEGFSSIRPDN